MNLLTQSVSFVCSPIKDAYNWATAQKNTEAENKFIHDNRDSTIVAVKRVGTDLPQELEEKVRKLISDLGYDATKVVLRIDDTRTSVASHSGSLNKWGFCRLVFSSKMAEEMAAGINPEHAFLIAHEMAHDIVEDATNHTVNILQSTSKFKTIAYAACLFATNYFFPGAGSVLTHISSVCISQFMGRHKEYSLSRKLEKACDLHAVKGRPDLAKAAIKYFEGIMALQKAKKMADPNYPSDEQGENPYDFKHPKMAERIKYLTATLPGH